MLDIRLIRERPEIVRAAIEKKHTNVDLDRIIDLDKEKRELLVKIENSRAERNKISKEISISIPSHRQAMIEKVEEIKAFLKDSEPRLREIVDELDYLLLLLPGIPHPSVPEGNSEEENIEVRRWGEIPGFDFEPEDHITLGESYFDFVRASKVSGPRNVYLKGDGALLEQAVLQFALNYLSSKGFTPFVVPQMVKQMAMQGTGFLPRGEEECYLLERDNMYLIGTSEVPLVSYHADEIFNVKDLPKTYAGFSSCYRREAGAAGRDTKGLYRVHQFQKIEQVVFCRNDKEESQKWHDTLLSNAEAILQALELPYRVVLVCGGEMGLPQHLKHDIECYMPSRGGYGETMSCSTMLDFQSRRLGIRYKEGGETRFCYTLNNTAIASPRILIPLLEVHQREDGSISIPKALRPYLNGRDCIKPLL